ncbi:MAG TPA: DUF6252 family protein [Ferruginibacter sp.]|jgi:hypothetical protein|nr:DUF6252 family protein [Ferruginibacter sp.]
MEFIKSLLIVFMAFVFMASSCTKQSNSPTNVLPPPTTQGLNTFGCLVNGQVFVPQKPSDDIGTYLECDYEFLYPGDTTKGYIFNVSGKDKPNGNELSSVGVTLDSTQLHQGDTFQLGSSGVGKKYGGYISSSLNTGYFVYNTTDTVTGQIIITFLDQANLIVSGTFWFDAISSSAPDTVHVRQGVFDMHYTR